MRYIILLSILLLNFTGHAADVKEKEAVSCSEKHFGGSGMIGLLAVHKNNLNLWAYAKCYKAFSKNINPSNHFKRIDAYEVGSSITLKKRLDYNYLIRCRLNKHDGSKKCYVEQEGIMKVPAGRDGGEPKILFHVDNHYEEEEVASAFYDTLNLLHELQNGDTEIGIPKIIHGIAGPDILQKKKKDKNGSVIYSFQPIVGNSRPKDPFR